MTGRFGTDRAGYRSMLALGRRWSDRVWAVEGSQGIGRHLAQRLVADGEPVVDVPAKLSARARVFSTGQGRKTDATDAHAIALVAVRTRTLQPVTADGPVMVLRLLSDRRDELAQDRTQVVTRLHRLLLELIPGGAPRFLSATQAKTLLAGVRPRDLVGKTRRALAVELLTELVALDGKLKASEQALRQAVTETGSGLMGLYGLGPVGAARVLGDIGTIARFPSKAHFASWNGTAPIDASSGQRVRHRLSRAGNRRINRVLHVMAIVQIRHQTEGRAYYQRKLAAGKTRPGSPGSSLPWRIGGAVHGSPHPPPASRARHAARSAGRGPQACALRVGPAGDEAAQRSHQADLAVPATSCSSRS